MNKFSLIIIAMVLSTVAICQNVGVNQPNPTNSLHVSPLSPGDHPVRIEGLQNFTLGDTSLLILNSTTGVLKFINTADLVNLLGGTDLGTDEQTLTLSNDSLSISDGNSVDMARYATPSGAIFAFPFASPPTGYLICDGQAVSRTTYPTLFALLGTTYGAGDGSTTFNLPNYNGQFLRGWDGGQGVDPDAATRMDRGDGVMGDVVGTKQGNQTLAHCHAVNPPSTSTNTTGAHAHSVDPPSTSTSTAGNHRHSWTYIEGNNDNGDATGWFDSSPSVTNQGTKTIYTNYAGNHSHAVNIAAFNSGTAGNHSHAVDIPQFDSASHGGSETRPTNVSVLWCIKY